MEYMFMPLRRYAEFSGRSRRMEYWMWTLFQMLLYAAVLVVMMVVAGGAMASGDPTAALAAGGAAMVVMGLYFLLQLAFIIPSIAVAVRRLHDTNRSGWWLLAPVVPYVLLFVGIGTAASSPDNMASAGILALVGGLAVLALAIMLLVFMLLDGTRGPNKYGPDPKGRADAEVFA